MAKSANKEDDARSDIKCCGFWSNKRQAYFDVKVVSPFAKSYARMKPAQLFKMAENAKIREYRTHPRSRARRLQPTCFHLHGRYGPTMSLGSEALGRTDEQEAEHPTFCGVWLRCRLSFALLRTTLLCVRATRRKRFVIDNNIELAVSEARMEH